MNDDVQTEIRALKKERDRFIKLAFCRADLLFELDDSYSVVFAAGALAPLFGMQPEKMKGRSFLDFVGKDNRARIRDLLDTGGRDGRISDVGLDLAGPKNVPIPVVVAGYRVLEFDNHYFLAIKVQSAKSDRPPGDPAQVIEDKEAFTREAAKQLKEVIRLGGDGKVTLVKVKNLKGQVGQLEEDDRDALMTAVGGVLQNYSLGGNTAGRIDDENFSYVHDGDVDPERVNMEVEEAAQSHLPDDAGVETKSVTLIADDAGMSEDQVAKAFLYAMQQFCSGDAKVTASRLSDALDELMSGTVDMAKYIKEVTRKQDFDLVFMPICDLRLGEVHHFEVLSRFRDQERAKSTFQIITLAENLGLIVDYDFAVAEKAIELAGELSKKGPLPSIAVNVSSLSLGTPAFVDRLHKRLSKDKTLKDRLMFELTESAEIENLPQINGIIQDFRNKGFKFCLDDFGAGAASFDYLNALEVDVVKFDGPVVRRACANKRGHDLLTMMAKMCTTAGVETVAEMVEDKKVANQVFYCGIDYGQGWYFGKPSADPFEFADDFAEPEK